MHVRRTPTLVAVLALLVPLGLTAGAQRRTGPEAEPAPVRGCLDRDMVLWANATSDQARGAPFWVDESHQFELLADGDMLFDLQDFIGHEVEIALLLEWDGGDAQSIAEPVAPGGGFLGRPPIGPGQPGGFGRQPRGPGAQPGGGGFTQRSQRERGPVAPIPAIVTEVRSVSVGCRTNRRGR